MDANYIFQVIASLLVAIALLILVVFVLKKMNFQRAKLNSHISVISTKNIGPRERLVLIEIAGKKLLLGATPQAINALHLIEDFAQPEPKQKAKQDEHGRSQSDDRATEHLDKDKSGEHSESNNFVDPKFIQILRSISGPHKSNNGLGG